MTNMFKSPHFIQHCQVKTIQLVNRETMVSSWLMPGKATSTIWRLFKYEANYSKPKIINTADWMPVECKWKPWVCGKSSHLPTIWVQALKIMGRVPTNTMYISIQSNCRYNCALCHGCPSQKHHAKITVFNDSFGQRLFIEIYKWEIT